MYLFGKWYFPKHTASEAEYNPKKTWATCDIKQILLSILPWYKVSTSTLVQNNIDLSARELS